MNRISGKELLPDPQRRGLVIQRIVERLDFSRILKTWESGSLLPEFLKLELLLRPLFNGLNGEQRLNQWDNGNRLQLRFAKQR